MSEPKSAYEQWTNVTEAWSQVGEAARRASDLYLKELASYLDWAHGVQREVLEQSVLATQELSHFGERQLAFVARMRESLPMWGTLPSGMETVQGMVRAVLRESTEPQGRSG